MMRGSVWLVAVAICLLLTISEAASSGGLRRVEDGGDGEVRETRQPTAAPTLENFIFGGDATPTDAPTVAPVPDDEKPASPAATPSEPAVGEDEATTLAPSVPDGNDDEYAAPAVAPSVTPNDDGDESTLAPACSVVPDDAADTAAPTIYLEDYETFSPTDTENAATETAPTQAPTVEDVASAPSVGNNDAPSDYDGDNSPAAAPADIYHNQGGYDDPTDYEDALKPPTEEPELYVPADDDPVKNEPGTASGETWIQPGESPEEMAHDRNVLIAVCVICGVAFLLMIITAQQMMENPDGCCARYEA
jgi:hypothetical protein